jgi:ElaB/YqjD/DUF883 family membrane-anchored ribosome-binding protein
MNTPFSSVAAKTNAVLDAAARGASAVAEGTDRMAHPAIDALAGTVSQVRDNAAPALHELAAGAEDLARHGARAMRERAEHLRDASAGYVRSHPLQTVAIAVGVGAALALLVRMLTRHSGPSR